MTHIKTTYPRKRMLKELWQVQIYRRTYIGRRKIAIRELRTDSARNCLQDLEPGGLVWRTSRECPRPDTAALSPAGQNLLCGVCNIFREAPEEPNRPTSPPLPTVPAREVSPDVHRRQQVSSGSTDSLKIFFIIHIPIINYS